MKECEQIDHEQLTAEASYGDDLSCAKDVERAEIAFFKHSSSIYHKFSYVDNNVLSHPFL